MGSESGESGDGADVGIHARVFLIFSVQSLTQKNFENVKAVFTIPDSRAQTPA